MVSTGKKPVNRQPFYLRKTMQTKLWLFLCYPTFLVTFVSVWILYGCASTKVETRIEDKTYTLPVPVIRDSIIVRVDTLVIEGEKIVRTDTVFAFKFYPAEKKVVYVVRPDSVKFVIRDTVTVFLPQENPERHSFFWFIGYTLVVVVVGAGIFGAIKVLKVFGV